MILKGGDSGTEKKATSGNLIKVIQDVSSARSLYLNLLKQATGEIMLMIPTPNGLDRFNKMGGVQILKDKSTNSGVKVRILTPLRRTLPMGESNVLREFASIGKRRNFQTKSIEQIAGEQPRSTILVVDRKFSLIMELKDDSKDSFIEAIGPSIYSNSTSSVLSYVTIFENLWQQSELYDQIKLANERLAEKSEQIVLKDKELQNLVFKLLQEDKSKEEFMSMVSHELKTPISVIKFYTDMLLKISKMGQTTDAQKKALATIYRNVDKLELLVNDILDVYKLDIGKMNITKSHIDVGELVNETISDLNSFIVEKNIKVFTDIKDNQSVNCDQKRIEQVLSNLIKNSIDFVPREKGIITIKVEHYDGTKDKRQMNEGIIYPVKNMTLFSIEDNGPGIPADKSENIFKKFYQIDTSLTRKHGGTGLGLTICKGIVEGHGGTIWIDKSSNEGTVVKFILPVDGTEE